jgi:hypothetical protein
MRARCRLESRLVLESEALREAVAKKETFKRLREKIE